MLGECPKKRRSSKTYIFICPQRNQAQLRYMHAVAPGASSLLRQRLIGFAVLRYQYNVTRTRYSETHTFFRYLGDAYRYTIQPIYENLTDSVACHIRRLPPSPILFDLFYFVEVTARGFRSPKIRHQVLADAVDGPDGGRRGSFVADYLRVEFDVGVNQADDFLLRASGLAAVQPVGRDQTVKGTVRKVDHSGVEHRGLMRFRVHEIAQSAAFVASVRPRKPFDVSTSRWRRPSLGAADAGAASCDMNPSKFLPADDADDDEHDSGRRQFQTVKAVIRGRSEQDGAFRYYIMSADSAPYFRFTIPSQYKPRADNVIVVQRITFCWCTLMAWHSYVGLNHNRIE